MKNKKIEKKLTRTLTDEQVRERMKDMLTKREYDGKHEHMKMLYMRKGKNNHVFIVTPNLNKAFVKIKNRFPDQSKKLKYIPKKRKWLVQDDYFAFVAYNHMDSMLFLNKVYSTSK